ncbi:hypothetical protein HDU93_004544, partial [Gonapodya sp. JEL0774]
MLVMPPSEMHNSGSEDDMLVKDHTYQDQQQNEQNGVHAIISNGQVDGSDAKRKRITKAGVSLEA